MAREGKEEKRKKKKGKRKREEGIMDDIKSSNAGG